MKRQSLAHITGVVLASLALVGGASAAVEVDFPVTPKAQHANVVQDNYLGISWELASFDTLCESLEQASHSSIRGQTTTMFNALTYGFLLNRGKERLPAPASYAELPFQPPRPHLSSAPHPSGRQLHGFLNLRRFQERYHAHHH